MRSVPALGGLLGAEKGVDSFVELTRQARPGRPAASGLPIGARDRALLMDRLATQVRDLHTACAERDCRLAVAISPQVIWKQPSPISATTGSSGRASLAAIAAGKPKPIDDQPLVIKNWRG